MFAKWIDAIFLLNSGIGACVYVFVNVLIIGILKSIACACWNASGGVEMLFFPFIIAAGIVTIIAFKNLISSERDFMLMGGILGKFAIVYFIVSIVSIVA